MKTLKNASLLLFILMASCKNAPEKVVDLASESPKEIQDSQKPDSLSIFPIEHATLVLKYKNAVIYVDPVGGADLFKDYEQPNYVLITDIHGDHMDAKTLEGLDLSMATLIVPKAVADKLPKLNTKDMVVMNNGVIKTFNNLKIEAIPMYNLRKEALQFHPKGRGNGYVLTFDNERVYISGDTEDIPEVRNLKDIDVAFVCMNLPYTMTVESAASAVLDFTPKKVYPYHYRGENGLSDVEKFKKLVQQKNADIQVIQLDWYK